MATNLGDYVLIKKLGEGAFGEVFFAEHRFLKKKYALKVLSDEVSSDPAFIQRFEEMIGVLATLVHPSIVKVHQISCVQGKYFLVMDPVVAENGAVLSLEKFLMEKEKISELQLEMILRQIASALDYAHGISLLGKSLVHQGLKLENIFIEERENSFHVFLSDFGLTSILGEKRVLLKTYERSLQQVEDQNTLLFKNFSFLSPEQKEGVCDVKTDVYAFGVLAYFLMTKKFPEGYFEMPSKFCLGCKLNWDLLVCKCLQSDPKKRPEKLTDALNALLTADEKVSSQLEVLSWPEVGKKVETAMQLSFEFLTEKPEEKKEPSLDQESFSKIVIGPQEISRPEYEPDPGAIFHKELGVSFYQPKPVETKELEPLLSDMVIIPGGEFYRGSGEGARDEGPRHKVVLTSFAVDVHPVTNEQFVRFLETMGGEKDSHNNDMIRLRDSRIKRSSGKLIIESGYGKHPVVGVTWYGASAYAKWIGKKLPTEAQWEIASAGGLENSLYPAGPDIDHTQANFFNSDTTAVMSYPANGYGLFDVVGNVYEWCQDWYSYNYYETSLQEPENPKGPLQGVYRVLRGGCWKSLKEDLRCSHRHRNNPGAFNGTYGFRCAAEVSS